MITNLKSIVLNDLHGYPYKFYRGGAYDNISTGRYFCSCFDVAKSYGEIIFEAEISVRNPLVIDATLNNGYSYYEQIDVINCVLGPENKRSDLMKYMKKVGACRYLSTDEILTWAKSTQDIDAVIVKNVREGINSNFPIYDIMVWDESVLQNVGDVTDQKSMFTTFRENTYKRVDLSSFIEEFEQDGMVNVTRRAGYSIEHHICQGNTCWYLSHDFVVYTEAPIEIHAVPPNSLTVDLIAPGKYQWNPLAKIQEKFIPNNGILRINSIPDIFAYLDYKIVYQKFDH